MNLIYERGERTELLPPIDAFVCAELGRAIAELDAQNLMLCEIGVWRGGWIFTLLANLPDALGFGIDPYPEAPALGNEVVADAAAAGFGERFHLGSAFQAFCDKYCTGTHRQFKGLFHIDGEHSEAAVMRDLAFCLQHASENAVIIVDDFWNASFPGVMSAAVRESYKGTIQPFLTTRQKLYFVPRGSASAELVAKLVRRLQSAQLPVRDGWLPDDGSNAGYSRASTIASMPVWQILMWPSEEAALERRLGVRPRPRTWRETAKSWLPPSVTEGLRRLRR